MKTGKQMQALLRRNTKHGFAKRGSKARLYNIWVRMKQRCFDPNTDDYKRYGGRGVTICEEWLRFQYFHWWAVMNGYEDNLSIDRIDNDGNYEPGNCRWVSTSTQSRNKSNNHPITFRGEMKTLAEWSDILGIESSLLRYRLSHWDIEKAFTYPIKGGKHEIAAIATH